MQGAVGRLHCAVAAAARSGARAASRLMRATRRPAAARTQLLPQRRVCCGVHADALPHASLSRAALTRQRSAPAGARGQRCHTSRAGARGATRVSAAGAAAEDAPPTLSGDMTWPQRDCECGTLRDADVGRRVTLCGWVDKQRNMGAVVFADVRDHTGIVQVSHCCAQRGVAHVRSCLTQGAPRAQVISDPGTPAHTVLERLRNEYVVLVTGTVRARSSANAKVATGNVEVVAESVTILNTVTRSLPFSVSGGEAASEEVRLKYVAAGRAVKRAWLTQRPRQVSCARLAPAGTLRQPAPASPHHHGAATRAGGRARLHRGTYVWKYARHVSSYRPCNAGGNAAAYAQHARGCTRLFGAVTAHAWPLLRAASVAAAVQAAADGRRV